MNDKQFEKLSFWQLLTKTKIEIPIIQRDYAQGREQQVKIRDNFLTALNEALMGNPVELDFVYGSKKSDTLQPLDGQQRLTTLFLLHWLIAARENKLASAKEQLLKFTYETRTSSREFCNELAEWSVDFQKLAELYKDVDGQSKGNTLSKAITNSAWFVLSWKKDPSISAMLIMLDALYEKFKDKENLWERLTDDQNPAITFFYIELKNFGLSDDLYIKMNARGKQLTPFEGFKSQFEKYIEKNEFEVGQKTENTFAYRIDTVWTDLFWRYRDNENLIDNEFINFFAGAAINNYAQWYESDKNSAKREEIEKRIQELANDPGKINPEDFSSGYEFRYLVDCLERYTDHAEDEIKTEKTNLWEFCEISLFREIISKEATQQQRALFYAQTEYLLSNKAFDQNEFDDWMRVVRNIVINAISGNWNIALMTNLIRLIHRWANFSGDIYSFLSNENPNSYTVAKDQINEEIRKAKIITAYPEYKDIICEIEDTDFCRGTINWCLECAGSDDIKELEKLRTIKELIDLHFGERDISNNVRRALLTIGDNQFYHYWGTWSYSTNTTKRALIENRYDLRCHFISGDRFENYFKPLIAQLMDKSLVNIINDYVCPQSMPHWKKSLIKESKWLDKHSHEPYWFGLTDDESQCYLYGWKQRPASRDECTLVE